MKSVVAEASTIAKAIELAWQKAGQPKEFLIKVFQEPQRNMFGLTKTSAKIGIFFDDAAIIQKIKTVAQSTAAVTHSVRQTSAPISPIKPIQPRSQTPKPTTPKIQKPQTKTEVAPRPAQQPLPTVKPQQTTNVVNKSTSQNTSHPAKPENHPSNHPVLNPVISDGATNPSVLPVGAEAATGNAPHNTSEQRPKTSRNRYYRRRKSRSSQTNNPEEKQATPPPVIKNEN